MKNTLRYTVIDFAVCGWVKWFSDNRSRRNEICLKNRTHWCRQRDIIELWDDSGRRGRDHKLFKKKRFRLDVRKFAFSNRVINYWSSSSSQCVNCCTVNTFKTSFSWIGTLLWGCSTPLPWRSGDCRAHFSKFLLLGRHFFSFLPSLPSL